MNPVPTSSSILLGFWKMHGLGNDYIVVDNRDETIEGKMLGNLAKRLCNRRFSVGADGLLAVTESSAADAKMRIFNADGSEAEMCGNGIRCFAKYCYENGITTKKEMKVETLAGVKGLRLDVENGEVKAVQVNMGRPAFERDQIPMLGEGKFIDEDLKVDEQTFKATCLSVGNPHCVVFIDGVEGFPLETFGPKIENHRLFPKRVNVEFVQVLNKHELKVRVWERGVGETLACGTGACASGVAAKILGRAGSECTVHLLGGDLSIEYEDEIYMTGPAEKVYTGEICLEVT